MPHLTKAQEATLAAAIRTETNAGVIAALASGDSLALQAWCASDSPTDAWESSMPGRLLFESIAVAKFTALSGVNREAWQYLLQFAPIDFSRNKFRKAVTDIWGPTDSVTVLQACVRKANYGEFYLGGTVASEGSVSALNLKVVGVLNVEDISLALNRNP